MKIINYPAREKKVIIEITEEEIKNNPQQIKTDIENLINSKSVQ
jgi:hypothetical protein